MFVFPSATSRENSAAIIDRGMISSFGILSFMTMYFMDCLSIGQSIRLQKTKMYILCIYIKRELLISSPFLRFVNILCNEPPYQTAHYSLQEDCDQFLAGKKDFIPFKYSVSFG